MSKKMNKTNAIRIVERNKMPYHLHEYSWVENYLHTQASLHNIQVPLEKVFKTLVVVGSHTGPIVACIPAVSEIDLKALASVSGNKRTELLPLSDLEKTTGYMRGGTSPIGMKKILPTFIAQEAKGLKTIIISAGKRGLQMELSPKDLATVTKAEFVDISARK